MANSNIVRHLTEDMLIKANGGWRSKVQAQMLRDDLILRGYGFYTYYERPVVAPAGKLYAEFTTPADKWVELTYREVTTDQERFFYRVYTGYGAVTLGADVRIGNLKAGSDASGSTLKLVTNAPSLVGATAVTILPVFGAATVGGRASGGLTTNAIARVIPPNTKFLIEFDNQSAAACYALLELNWVELPESAVDSGGI